MSELIYNHRAKKIAYADVAGNAEYSFADFVAGEVRPYALRFLKTSGEGSIYEEYPNLKTLTASVSLLDKRPTAGSVAYQFGGGLSTADNTTAELRWNHNARALQDAINAVAALVTAYGQATVYEVPGGFTIYFASATGAIQIRSRKNRLAPLTVVRSWAHEVDGEWIHEIRLLQAPLAATSTWARVPPPAPTIEPVQDGGFDNSGQFPTPEVQRLNMPPEFLGVYQIRRPDNLARTTLLERSDNPETVVQDAIRAIYGGETGITVKLFENYAHITFAGGLNGTDIPLLEIVVEEAPPGDVSFELDFRRKAVYDAVRATGSATAFFEVRAYIDAPDAPPENTGKPEVLFRKEVRVVMDQNYDGSEVAVDPPWLRPPNPVDYTPTTPDQIQSGIAWWIGVKGNGVATVIACDHDMATEDIAGVTVLDNASGELRPPLSWAVTNANTVTLTYAEAPALDSLKVIIAGAVPVSQWDPHSHTQEQIVDLVDDLEELFGRVWDLEQYIPSTGPAVLPGASVAGHVITIRKVSELLHYQGEEKIADLLDEKEGLKKSPDDQDRPYLLPAIHDALLDALPDPLPAAAGNAGKVYTAAVQVRVSPGSGIAATTVKVGELVGCDGRSLFAVKKDGETNSYFPVAFERPVARIAVDDKLLPVTQTLDFQWAVQAQAMDADCTPQWVLYVDIGEITAASSPAPVGLNIAAVTWAETPVFEHAFRLDPNLQTHSFGVRIKRGVSEMTLDQRIGNGWTANNAAAPASPNFVLRARLIKFDIEDAASSPRGWIYWGLTGAMDAEGKTTELRAIIK